MLGSLSVVAISARVLRSSGTRTTGAFFWRTGSETGGSETERLCIRQASNTSDSIKREIYGNERFTNYKLVRPPQHQLWRNGNKKNDNSQIASLKIDNLRRSCRTIDQPVLNGIPGQTGYVVEIEFFHQIGAMILSGFYTDTKLLRHFFGAVAFSNEL